MQHDHPHDPHDERHFMGGDVVRDVVIGMSDGLTVPFALAAGLSGAVALSSLIVTAGLAEIAAGSIAMGLGGFLAARTESEHYASEEARERREVKEIPREEEAEIEVILQKYGLTVEEVRPIIVGLKRDPVAWVDFMMRFELGLERPDPGRAHRSAFTIAISYVLGGLVPLSPYFFYADSHRALMPSIAVTLIALAIFGFVKGRFTGAPRTRSAIQTVVVGALAASAAYVLARWIGGPS